MQMRTHCLSIVLWDIVLLFDVFCSYYFMSSVSATPSKSPFRKKKKNGLMFGVTLVSTSIPFINVIGTRIRIIFNSYTKHSSLHTTLFIILFSGYTVSIRKTVKKQSWVGLHLQTDVPQYSMKTILCWHINSWLESKNTFLVLFTCV